jgi:DNA-binding MarR family transcriptional regulator
MRTIAPSEPIDATDAPAATDAPVATDRAAVAASIIAQFRDALRELKCLSGDRMRRTGLSFGNSHVLAMLDRHGELSMSSLAELLDVSLSNASGVVDRLAERGLVERFRVPDDRRVVFVRVSEAGRARLAEADVLREELMQTILGRLDERRLRRVAAALDDVTAAATEVFATDPELSRHEHVLDHGHRHPADRESATAPASPA